MKEIKLTSKKKMRNTLFISFLIMICLIVRIGYIQLVQGKELSKLAYEQQTLDRKINPKRGTIYDASGNNILAVSSTVETITVNPGNISDENKEKVAKTKNVGVEETGPRRPHSVVTEKNSRVRARNR